MRNLIDGKAISISHRKRLKLGVAELKRKGICPTLVIYAIGEHPASTLYFNTKRRLAESLGIVVYPRQFAQIEEDVLIRQIENCNANDAIDGIFVELPLPPELDARRVRRTIAPSKDVDGINPINLGKLVIGEATLLPATPTGVVELLRAKGVRLAGKDVVVVGRSDAVGTPLALLLQRQNATVTMCHSQTRSLSEKTRRAEVLCVAVGVPNFVRADMVQAGAVVIDVGVNTTAGGTVVGDVDFAGVQPKAKLITPVPGGVGPMVSTMVMDNVVQSARRRL